MRRGASGGWRVAVVLAALTMAAVGAGRAGKTAAQEQPALLFVITGQSNAGQLGKGVYSAPGAWYYAPMATGKNAWVPLASVKGYHGVEVPFARAIQAACPGVEVGMVKVWANSTSVIAWDPEAPNKAWSAEMALVGNSKRPPQYPRVMSLKAAADAARAAEGKPPARLAGVLWVQNEKDARDLDGAVRYEGKLRKLITAWRADWAAPGLTVVMMDSHTSLGIGGEIVHQAIVNVVEGHPQADQTDDDDKLPAVAQTAWVASRDLPTQSDGVHFTSAGLFTLGQRMAAAWLALNGGCG